MVDRFSSLMPPGIRVRPLLRKMQLSFTQPEATYVVYCLSVQIENILRNLQGCCPVTHYRKCVKH